MSNNFEKGIIFIWNGYKIFFLGVFDIFVNCFFVVNFNNEVCFFFFSDFMYFFILFVYFGIVNGMNCIGKVIFDERFEKIDYVIKFWLGWRSDNDFCVRYEGNLSSIKRDIVGIEVKNSIIRLKLRMMGIEIVLGSGICDLILLVLLWNCGKLW